MRIKAQHGPGVSLPSSREAAQAGLHLRWSRACSPESRSSVQAGRGSGRRAQPHPHVRTWWSGRPGGWGSRLMGYLGMDRGVPIAIPKGHVARLGAEVLAPNMAACPGSPSPESVDAAPDRASPAPGVIPPASSKGTPRAGKPVGDHLGPNGCPWRAHLRRSDCLGNKGWEGRQPWSVSHEMGPQPRHHPAPDKPPVSSSG